MPLRLPPILQNFPWWPALRVILGVVLVSGVIGFLTPMLVDRWSGGDADRAGKAYAVNVLGCISGPALRQFRFIAAPERTRLARHLCVAVVCHDPLQ